MSFGKLAFALSNDPGARRVMAHRTARPNHLLEVAALEDFYGAGGDMLPPTRAEAMSVPAMARARHIICTAARLPIRINPSTYRHVSLIEQPDPDRTRAAILTDTLDDLLFEGIALWRVSARYAHDDRPRHATRVARARWAWDPHTQKWLIDDKPVAGRDLIWIEGPHAGVCDFGGRALRSAVKLERAYAATASNPAVAWELHQTSGDVLTPEEVADLVASARTAVAQRGVLFTDEALELKMHAAAVENLLISGRNAAAVDVARMVGIPAASIDAHAPGSSGTYSNVQARLREARDIGVDAYASAITARLSLDDILPRGVTCAFEWDQLLRADFAERMAGYAAAQAAEIFTAAECRDIERGPAQEGTP